MEIDFSQVEFWVVPTNGLDCASFEVHVSGLEPYIHSGRGQRYRPGEMYIDYYLPLSMYTLKLPENIHDPVWATPKCAAHMRLAPVQIKAIEEAINSFVSIKDYFYFLMDKRKQNLLKMLEQRQKLVEDVQEALEETEKY